jgi:hypothetical protein
MVKTELNPLTKTATWTLQNPVVRLEIEKSTGLIRSLYFKAKKVDLFQQLRGGISAYACGLRIYDERDEVWYEDLKSPFTISKAKLSGQTLTFSKHYKGAPFSITVSMSLDRGMFKWVVEAEKNNARVTDRSLRVYFSMPLIAGWDLWAPCLVGERVFDGMTPFEHCYTQISYVSTSEVILPMVSHYSKSLDVGYSMLNPIDAKVPASKFLFQNADRCFTWRSKPKQSEVTVLEGVNYYIGLAGNRPMRTEMMLAFHEGDWRPALGQVFNRWKKFFVPKNDLMYELEGMFNCIGAHAKNCSLKQQAKHQTKLMEVHGHFSFYSDYYNEGHDRWIEMGVLERVWEKTGRGDATLVIPWIKNHTPQEVMARVEGKKPEDYTLEHAESLMYTTRQHMKNFINEAAERGIHPFWYFNYTDGFRPAVEKRWPDAICRNEDGSYQSSGWKMCHNMNSDPKYSFGKFMIESAKKIVKEHPKLKGFFLDCFRHFDVDFAHDDGITVVNNRPAYSINFSYDGAEDVIERLLLKNNMCTFANKPQTIRSMRWVDGMMLEGDGDNLEEKYFYSCLAKPIIFLWTSNAATDDENCRRSLLLGCYPKVECGTSMTPEQEAASIAMRKQYLPMYAQFSRRVLCFEADPLRVPASCRGKLYTVGQDYIVGVVNLHLNENMEVRHTKTLYTMFRVQRGHDVGKVGIMYPGQKEWTFVDFKFNGTFIAVPMKDFVNCAVIKLFVTQKTGKTIGAEKFQGAVDSCGDPDSSFTDLSGL